MVHGISYVIQYEVYLKEEIDFFNDFLPICISLRTMFKYEKCKYNNGWKIIVLSDRQLKKRFSQLPYSHKFVQCMYETGYNDDAITRESHPEIFKYYDAFVYSQCIKNANYTSITQDEFNELKERYNYVKNILNGNIDVKDKDMLQYYKEMNEIRNNLKIQNVLIDKDYFDSVKQLYNELTDIKLTEDENSLIETVINHPKLEGLIIGMNFTLTSHNY